MKASASLGFTDISRWVTSLVWDVVRPHPFLTMACQKLEKSFGKMKRNSLPFVYIGVRHSRLPDGGIFLEQGAYLEKLKVMTIDKRRLQNSSSPLQQQEHFDFRALVCSMLWLCLTRIDIVSDIVQLQQHMTTPTIEHAKLANATLVKAKRNKVNNGLHFRKFRFPLKVQGIGDA